MANVSFNISMSLDGFITAGNQTKEEPLGENGVVTHRPLLASHSTGIYHAASGIADAVAQATAAANGKDVSLMGGGNVFRQALA